MSTLLIQLLRLIVGPLIRLIFSLLDDLEKENLTLRYQIIALKRESKRPQIKQTDRFILSALSQCFDHWKKSILIVRPETILKWHRTLAAKRWTKDKPLGRRPVSREIRQLVIRVKNKSSLGEIS
jgi:putative transposase